LSFPAQTSRKFRSGISFERLILLLVDFSSVSVSATLTWFLRYRSGIFADLEPFTLHPLAIVLLSLFWMSIFALRGQYRKLHHISRFRAVQSMLRSVAVGLIFLFLLIFDPENAFSGGKLLMLFYGAILFLGASTGRVMFRTVQKRMLERGIGLRNTLVIGSDQAALRMIEQFNLHPGMGYLALGMIKTGHEKTEPAPEMILSGMDDLSAVIHAHEVKELIVTVPSKEVLYEVIGVGTSAGAEVLIITDLYDLVLGNVKTTDIWAIPVIQVFPHLMAPWQNIVKRVMDICLALLFLLPSVPLLLVLSVYINIVSPGAPAFYRQRRIGRKGREFTLLKMRTMIPEENWPKELSDSAFSALPKPNDPRLIKGGRVLRRYRVDEIPQLWNILIGQMTFVGPRPEQRELVEEYILRWPLYSRRHNVRPGLTGWAQVKQKYDQSICNLEDKLRLDMFYLQNMSLSLDIKVIFFTIRTILRGDG
jgi:exopolysaccharide biosynthesis polyprenyl glycosylphosphotransferase